MAERIVSPGVFTQERDLSFLEQGVGEIAGAFIGPTPRGPAFIPTVVTSPSDFEAKFGELISFSQVCFISSAFLGLAKSSGVFACRSSIQAGRE